MVVNGEMVSKINGINFGFGLALMWDIFLRKKRTKAWVENTSVENKRERKEKKSQINATYSALNNQLPSYLWLIYLAL